MTFALAIEPAWSAEPSPLEPKPTEWKGAVDAIDPKAKSFAMLVVGKNVPQNGKVVTLKLTDATRYYWRTEDAREAIAGHA